MALDSLSGQEASTSPWTLKQVSGFNVAYTSLTNWAAGGEDTFSWNVYLNAAANYKRDKWSWDNALAADFGMNYTEGNKWQKSVDKLNISTKAGYAFAQHWYASLLGDFLTQFAEGHKNAADKLAGAKYVSRFMSPGYITIALGADYKPNKNFSLLVSPVAGKLTLVTDDYLSEQGAYGVTKGKKGFAELGASAVANINQTLWTNLSIISKLTLFSAYNNNFGNIDINWDVMLAYKINKFLTTTLTTNLIYDDDVKSYDKAGVQHGPKVQFRHIFGLGVSYSL